MGKMQREKGKRGEREVAELLTDSGFPAHRAQQFKGSAGSADVTCPAFVRLGLHVEVKNTARPTLGPWLEKSWQEATQEGLVPAIFWKRPRDDWYVIMPASALLNALKRG